jgi:hypothetical protein
VRSGEWEPFAATAAAGLAATSSGEVDPDDLAAAAAAFRRERRLFSADDLAAWLDERDLTAEQWKDWLRRSLLRGTAADPLSEVADAEAVRVDALCEGVLAHWAEHIVSLEARARAAGVDVEQEPPPVDLDSRVAELAARCPAFLRDLPDLGERLARLVSLAAGGERFDAGEKAAQRYLADHRLDWVQLSWDEVPFEQEGEAREAALLVRADGLGLGDVAAVLGRDMATAAGFVYQLEPDRRSLLVAAQPGELVGPVALASGWTLLSVRERVQPSDEDPAVVAAARDALTASAVERYSAGKVVWHGAL